MSSVSCSNTKRTLLCYTRIPTIRAGKISSLGICLFKLTKTFYTILIQTGSPIPASHQASHFNSYATSITSVPLTTPCSSTSRDNSIAADVQSDICSDSNSGDIGNNQLEVTSVRDDFNQHNQQHRIPYEHAPVYFLKVFFTPAPLRQ